MTYQIQKLKNGVRYSIITLTDLKTALLGVYLEAGSIYGKKIGIPHLLEHLFFSSYKEKHPRQKDYWRGTTSPHYMRFTAETPFTDLKKTLVQLREMVFEPIITEELIEKEKNIVLNELHNKFENASINIFDEVKKARFHGRNPYDRGFRQEIKSLDKITEKDIKEFYYDKFTTDNTLVFIGLPGSKNEMAKIILEEIFGSIKKMESKSEKMPEVKYSRKKFVVKKTDSRQSYLSLSFPYQGKYNFNDILTSLTFLDLLGIGKDSILMKNLRYDKGLIYHIGINVYPSISGKTNFRFFTIESSTRPEFLSQTFQTIIETTKEFAAGDYEGLLKQKIKEAINDFKDSKVTFSFIIYFLLKFGRLKSLAAVKRSIKNISPRDINKAAKLLINFDYLNVILFGNTLQATVKEIKKLVRKLR